VNTILLTEFNQEAYDKGIIINDEIKMVKNLMETTQWSLEKAMSALKIPEEHRQYIIPEFEK
jgi:hypothetical protein